MSKCRTAFEKFAFEAPDFATMEPYDIAVLAWNARGKVDAGIARDFHANIIRDDCLLVLANTIEMKNER